MELFIFYLRYGSCTILKRHVEWHLCDTAKKKSTLHARSIKFSALQSPFARLSFVVFFAFGIANFLRLLSTPRAFLGIVGVDIEGRTRIQMENTRKISVLS